MIMAGYSKTTLDKKLGLKMGITALVINPPAGYLEGLDLSISSEKKDLEFVQIFTTSKKELEKEFPKLKQALVKDGTLWVSWPKRASGVETDLDENKIREVGLKSGLVDIKVIAIDEVWSGLKFVYRLKDRA